MPEYIVLLRPTTPIRDVNTIEKAIHSLQENGLASAVVSAHYAQECPYKWVKIGQNGYLESPFYGMKPDDVNLPRQSFERLLVPDGYVDVLKSRTILDEKCVYGEKAIPFLIQQEVVDIDCMEDLQKVKQTNISRTEIYSTLCNYR